MAKESSGLVLCRDTSEELEVLLVHPGGPFFRWKDHGAWSIPKGEVVPGEDPLAAAIREVTEELGISPSGPYISLGSVRQAGGKVIHAWACRGVSVPMEIRSNTFWLEWPPNSGTKREFPEVDRAEYFGLAQASEKMNAAQRLFLERIPAPFQSRLRAERG